MKQSRISMLETPGAANITLDTLSRIAAAFKVGVIVKFVPFSEMLQWENNYSQDDFDVVRINSDTAFLNPAAVNEIIVLPITAPAMAVSGINFNYGEVWTLPDSASRRASGPLAPVELVAAAASGMNVYSGAKDAN